MPDNDPNRASNTVEQALGSGQLDTPEEIDDESSEGPTPDTETSVDEHGDGPTPSDHPTPDSAEDESEPDTDTEDKSKETDSEEEDEFFFEGEHSQYRSEEEYRRAVDQKDELINKFRDRIEEEQEEKERLRQRLERQQEVLPEEQRKELVMRQLMADELGDKYEEIASMTEEDLQEHPENKEQLLRAQARAEIRYEDMLEQAQEEREQMRTQRKKQLEQAEGFVRDSVTEDRFGVSSTEERIRLGEFFQEPLSEGNDSVNLAEAAVMIHADYGEKAADLFLNGLQSEFRGEETREIERELNETKENPRPEAKRSDDASQKKKEAANALETLESSFTQSEF